MCSIRIQKINAINKGIIIFTVIFFLLFFCGTCDHSDPEGKIIPSPIEMSVGDTAFLHINVPDKYNDMHSEQWQIIPDSLGILIYDVACTCEQLKARDAMFIAVRKGTGIIEVWGIFKQTNYQFVAEAEVTVQ